MPENLLHTVRSHAQKLDVPYQSLIKLWVAEKAAELSSNPPRSNRRVRR